MVLSNKKLKQKLRSNLAESLTASMAETKSNNDDSTNPDPNSKPKSLKQLMDSETQKPRLTKREKRRKTLPLPGSEVADRSGNGENGVENKENKIDNGEKKMKKKRKREVDGYGNGVVENGGSGSMEITKAAAKEKMKKKKRKRDGHGDGDGEVENGGLNSMEDGEAVKKESKVNKKKNMKKKRKSDGNGDGDVENGGLNSMEDGEAVKKESKVNKKKKKKKKKNKKKGKKEEEKKGVEVGNGGNENQGVTEAVEMDVSAVNSQGNGDVATKIYVGGIPYYSTEDDIRSYFEGCGTITEIDCMTFPESGKFRGIAIISFKTEAAAKRALALDGADMGGLFLKIQRYKTTRENKASDFSPEIVEGYNRIYIGNLSWDITEDDLKKFFSDCKISSIRFGMDKETGEFRGYAHVDFSDSLSLTMALKLDQQIVCGRPVKIRCAVPKKVGESKKPHIQKETESKKADTNKEEESKKADTKEEGESKKADGDGTMSIGSGKIKRRTCYECGEKGHLSSACPNKKPSDLTNPNAS